MTDSCGETALHFLAIENDLEGVAWLHRKGQPIDTVDGFGEPVIFAVAQLGYKELFTWFAHTGANLNARNADGLSLTNI
jgi:ankyrin repeat protein